MNGLKNIEQWRTRRHEESVRLYTLTQKNCKYCGKSIPYEKRANDYCNHSCFASNNNKGVCRNKLYYEELRNLGVFKTPIRRKIATVRHRIETKSCPKCKSIFDGHRDKIFCTRKCRRMFETEEKIQNGVITYRSKHAMRRYLKDLRGHRCEDCGNTTWDEVEIPLDMHHIDGNVTNMALENLKLLCPNCHTMTINYKSKNRNKNTNRKIYGK